MTSYLNTRHGRALCTRHERVSTRTSTMEMSHGKIRSDKLAMKMHSRRNDGYLPINLHLACYLSNLSQRQIHLYQSLGRWSLQYDQPLLPVANTTSSRFLNSPAVVLLISECVFKIQMHRSQLQLTPCKLTCVDLNHRICSASRGNVCAPSKRDQLTMGNAQQCK